MMNTNKNQDGPLNDLKSLEHISLFDDEEIHISPGNPVEEEESLYEKFILNYRKKYRKYLFKSMNNKHKVSEDTFSDANIEASMDFCSVIKNMCVELHTNIMDFLKKVNCRITIDLDFLFDIFFILYQLIRKSSLVNTIYCVIMIVKKTLGIKLNSYKNLITKYTNDLIKSLNDDGKMKVEAFEVPIGNAKGIFKLLVKSKVFTSLRIFILNLVGLRFFDCQLTNSFIKTLGSPPHDINVIDFTYQMIDTIENFINFNNVRRQTGSIIKALKSSDPVSLFMDRSQELVVMYKSVYAGDDMNFVDISAMSGSISASNYIVQLNDCLKNAKEITDIMNVDHYFKLRVFQLKEINRELSITMQSKKRRAPLGIIISGDPSIGKSSILVHIYKLFAQYKKLKYSDDLIYHRAPKSKYWSGYSPLTQPIIHYPELGSVNMKIAMNKGDEAIDEMLLVADTQPFCPEKAAVDEKGKDYVIPQLLVVDCNDPEMNLKYLNNNPAAIRRRFIYIEAVVKNEYRSLPSAALDDIKVANAQNVDKMDLWNFTVCRKEPMNLVDSVRKDYVTKSGSRVFNIYQLSDLLIELFGDHDKKQMRFSYAVDEDVSKYLNTQTESKPSAFSSVEVDDDGYLPSSSNVNKPNLPWKIPFVGGGTYYFFGPLVSFIIMAFWFLVSVFKLYLMGRMGFKSFLFYYLATIYLKCVKQHGVLESWVTYGEDINVYVVFSYYWVKNLFVDDPKIERYRLRVANGGFFSKLHYSLILFLIGLSFARLVLSFFRTAQAFTESETVQSSGLFTPENYKAEVEKVEVNTGTNFPLPKKKNGTSKDYDKVENFVPRYVSDSKTLNKPTELTALINKNRRWLKLYFKEGKSCSTSAVGVCSNYIIFNKHSLMGNTNFDAEISLNKFADGVTFGCFSSKDYTSIGDDIILLRFPEAFVFKDIRPYLIDVPFLSVSCRGFAFGKDITLTQLRQPQLVMDANSKYPIELKNAFEYNFEGHKVGDCGSPVIGYIGEQTVLLGIHSAGYKYNEMIEGSNDIRLKDRCFASPILKSKVLEGINFLDNHSFVVCSEGNIRLPVNTTLGKITERSPLLFEDHPSLICVGHVDGKRHRESKSSLLLSPLVKDIKDLIGEDPYLEDGNLKYLPPLMRAKFRDGTYVSPYNEWIKKIGVTKKALNPLISDVVVKTITDHFISELKKKGIEKLTPYPLSVAQNGYPENFYVRSMKNSTSGGFLFPGTKSYYNSDVVLDFKEDGKEPDFDVQEQVLEIINNYASGECSHSIVAAQLKDEPRSFEKVMKGKTRVFAMSSYDSTLVNRMYLMPFYSLMCQHNDVFNTKVGVNMLSREGDDMYKELVTFSKNILEGDYGGFDTSMPVDVGIMANKIVYNVLRGLGYNEEALKIVTGILTDNLFPVISLEDNLFVAPGFQPSGKYATAEDNSLRGLILLVYAFVSICTKEGKHHSHNKISIYEPKDFFRLVKPMIYGDDVLCSVKSGISNYFNNIKYSEFVSGIYGMEFTSASKVEHLKEFVNPSEMSFLKRKFKECKFLNRHLALLDKESLMRSLMYIMPSKYVDNDALIVETCCSMMREYYMHIACDLAEFDDKPFNEFRDKVILLIEKHTRFVKSDIDNYLPLGSVIFDM